MITISKITHAAANFREVFFVAYGGLGWRGGLFCTPWNFISGILFKGTRAEPNQTSGRWQTSLSRSRFHSRAVISKGSLTARWGRIGAAEVDRHANR